MLRVVVVTRMVLKSCVRLVDKVRKGDPFPSSSAISLARNGLIFVMAASALCIVAERMNNEHQISMPCIGENLEACFAVKEVPEAKVSLAPFRKNPRAAEIEIKNSLLAVFDDSYAFVIRPRCDSTPKLH